MTETFKAIIPVETLFFRKGEGEQKQGVVLIPCPFQAHISPMSHLVRRLLHQGGSLQI